MEVLCFECKKVYEVDETLTIGRREECPHCCASTRCCKMCEFYDPSTYNECREIMAERIKEKDQGNFCNYFRIVDKDKSKAHKDNREENLDAANAIFKK